MVRLSFHVFDAAQPSRLGNAPGAFDFVVPYAFVAHAPQLIPRGFDRGVRAVRRRFGLNSEHADAARRVIVRGNARHELALACGAIEPRCAPSAEHGRQHFQRRRVGVIQRHRAPAEGELRLRNVTGQLAKPESGRRALHRAGRSRRLADGEVAIQPVHGAKRMVRIHVTDHDEHRGGWPVEVAVEAPHIVAGQPPQTVFAADAPTPDAMFVVHQFVQGLDHD